MEALLPLLLPLVPQLVSAIPMVTTGVKSLIAFIASIRSAAMQAGAWTPAMESAFIEALIADSLNEASLTDAEIAARK